MQPDNDQAPINDSVASQESVTQSSSAQGQEAAPVAVWQFTGGSSTHQDTVNPVTESAGYSHDPTRESVEWTASEYVAHNKSLSWFVALGIIAMALTVAVYVLTGRDPVSAIVVPIVAVLFGYSAARRPQVRRFKIDSHGITMGSRFHPFSGLKSFTVSGEGAIKSIVLIQLKRYMPPVSIYYPPDQEERIMEVLGKYLPFEPERHDNVERVMRRIKF